MRVGFFLTPPRLFENSLSSEKQIKTIQKNQINFVEIIKTKNEFLSLPEEQISAII